MATNTVQLRGLFKNGKFKDVMTKVKAASSTEELKQVFEPDLSLPLHYAAARGYLEAVRLLIQTHKCDPEYQNVYGITALHCASYCGRLNVVKDLVIQKKCDPTVVDKKGACPIVYCTYCTVKRARLDSPLDYYSRKVSTSKQHLQIAKLLLTRRAKYICGTNFNPKLLTTLQLPLHCGSLDDLKDMTEILKLSEECESKEYSFEVYKCLKVAVDENKWDFVQHILYSYPGPIKVALAAQISKRTPRHADFNDDKWVSSWEQDSSWRRPYVIGSEFEDIVTPSGTERRKPIYEIGKLPCYITPFHKVCMYMDDNIDLAKAFLELGVCKPDVTSLQIVISRGLNDLAKYLIENADHAIIMDEYDQWSSLLSHVFESSKYQQVCYDQNIVKLIVEACSDNRDSNGNTPLHLACQYSVKFIVDEYSKCHHQNSQNNSGQLPLHIACEYSDLGIIKVVSSHPELAINTTDSDGNTPFHTLCSSIFEVYNRIKSKKKRTWNYHHRLEIKSMNESIFECINYFIVKKKCDVSIKNKLGEMPIHNLLKKQEKFQTDKESCSMWEKLVMVVCSNQEQLDVNAQDEDGNTPLHIACRIGDLTTIKYLISNFSCNLNLLNEDDCLPLHYVATSLEAIRIVSDGCTIMHTVNKSGMTPLHIACKDVQLDVVKFLVLEQNCLPICSDQSQTDIYNNLYIHMACQNESDITLLKALANKQNINNSYDGCNKDFQGKTPILVACVHNNLLAVKFLVECNCDLLCKDLQGMLPVHLACSQSLMCLMSISQKLKANDVNICDKNGDTPLHLALKHNRPDVVEYLLLNFSCDMTIKNKTGESPLHLACSITDERIATMLIKQCKFVDGNCQTLEGDTPLHIACISGALSIAQQLVQQYDCTPSMTQMNSRGWLPIDYACGQSLEMIELVGKVCTVENLAMRRSILTNNNSLESDSSIVSPTTLDIACFYGFLDIIQYLVDEKGCTLLALGNNQTALMYACGLLQVDDDNTKSGHSDVVKFLISECGYDPTLSINEESIIKLVCQHNQQDIMKALVCISPDISDTEGNTPLHYACQYGCIFIVHMLIDQKCDQKIVNKEKELALHEACCNSLEVTRLVNECDVNSQNTFGDTPLHLACANNKGDIVQYLIEERKCDINIPNGKGELAIHIASRQSQAITKLLHGCDLNHQDNSRNTPLHIACSSHRYEVLDYLLQDQSCRADLPNSVGDLALHALMKAEFINKNLALSKESKIQILHIIELLIERNNDATVFTNSDGVTPTHIAIMSGEVELLEIFFRSKGLDTEAKSKFLYVACEHGQSQMVQWFIDHGTNFDFLQCLGRELNISQQYKDGNTILHLACRKENDSELVCVLKSVSDLGNAFSIQNDKGDTPLHILVANSKIVSSNMLSLIKYRNPNIKNRNGDTPLHIACCRHDSVELLKFLSSSDNINMQNNEGNTPLHVACKSGNIHVSLYLIRDLNCSLSILNNDEDSAFHLLLSYESKTKMQALAVQCYFHEDYSIKSVLQYVPNTVINKSNKNVDTILHLACKNMELNMSYETVSLLVKSLKCCTNIIDGSGATPLHYACGRGLTEVVKLVSNCTPTAQVRKIDLKKVNVTLNYTLMNAKFVLHDTPLHTACRVGKVAIVKHLLNAGHKEALTVFNEVRELPFHIACSHNEAVMAGLFIAYRGDFDCNAPNASGDTPLHIICRKDGNISNFISLLVYRMKCRTNVIDGDGNLPLHIACRHKIVSIRTLKILSTGLNSDQISLKNILGSTILHEVLKIPHDKRPIKYTYLMEIVQFIADKMSNSIAICDNDNQQPIHLACRHHRLSMVKYFFEHYSSLSFEIPPTVLHEACFNDREGVLSYMLENYELHASASNSEGDLPLHIAMREKRSIQSILLLLKKTIDVNHANCNGNTPLHELCRGSKLYGYKRLKVLKTLLSMQSIQISVQNIKGQTPLHVICETGQHGDHGIMASATHNIYFTDAEDFADLQNNCEKYHYNCIDDLCLSGAVLSIKDNEGQTPLTLTKDPEIIKLLLKHGADPQPLYDMHKAFFKKYSCEKPPPTPVKLLVIGDPLVGKTTMIKSLQNESSSDDRLSTEEPPHTAGIVSTSFSSEIYGDVTFYDFAGQREYYASHDTFILHYVKNIPPIIVVLVNLSESIMKILNQTQYWINFMANRCVTLSDEAHLVIVCSHADVFTEAQSGNRPLDKVQKLHPLIKSQLHGKRIILQGILHMNCKLSRTPEMEWLQHILKISTDDVRVEGVMKFNLHCFYVLLLQSFMDKHVVTLNNVLDLLNQVSKDFKQNPLSLLQSDDTSDIIQFCYDLDENGQIMFIEHPSDIKESWLVLDSKRLLGSQFLGSLFAPTTFPQHCPLSYSTGVVPLSLFEEHFSTSEWHNYTATMLLSFLTRLECCREVTDLDVIESIVEQEHYSETEKYYFFPNLVSIVTPQVQWSTDSSCSHKCGWLIQCTKQGEFFNPHFIQALLLRLVFLFTPGPRNVAYNSNDYDDFDDSDDDGENQAMAMVIKRVCSVWKSGIYWQGTGCVKIFINIDKTRTLLLLMQCPRRSEAQLLKQRSQIISMVLKAKEEFCRDATLLEYFMHPHVQLVTYPQLELAKGKLFSLPCIVEQGIVNKELDVCNDHNTTIALEDLVYFEPYCELSIDVIKDLFDKTKSHEQVPDSFLLLITKQLSHRYVVFSQLYHRSAPHRRNATQSESEDHIISKLVDIFKKQLVERTFHHLHQFFNQISIFRGRQPLQDEQLSALQTSSTETADDAGCDEVVSLLTLPKPHQLDLIEGNGKTVRVIERVAADWVRVATSLHFQLHDIRIIQADCPNQCEVACRRMFGEWLASTNKVRQPVNWDTLIKVLVETNFSEIAADLRSIIIVTAPLLE